MDNVKTFLNPLICLLQTILNFDILKYIESFSFFLVILHSSLSRINYNIPFKFLGLSEEFKCGVCRLLYRCLGFQFEGFEVTKQVNLVLNRIN